MKIIIQVLIFLFTVALSVISFAKEFSADMISQMVTGNIAGKIYIKSPDVTRNEMMGMVSITNRPKVYQIYTSTKKYHVSNVDEIKDKNPLADAGDFKSWIKKHKLQNIGKESISGYQCQIYEGELQMDQAHSPTHMKLWYSEKLNYPIKTEIILPPPMGKVTSLLENIKLGKQPDSLFAIPAGYSQAASIEEAMGVPNMGALMGDNNAGSEGPAAGNKIPSQEEITEMMEKMQGMMKQMQQNSQ